MRRIVVPELLDTDAGTPAEIESSLADLRAINRRFGGAETLFQLVRAAARQRGLARLSLLDVAGASGDVPRSVQSRLRDEGIELAVTVLDRVAGHLNGCFPAIAADALRMPLRDASFDLVSCSLFLHHLEPEEIISFVDEALRVTRHAVLLNDLRRTPLHLALVYAARPLFRSPLTKHDAPASVRRAYTPSELRTLVGRTRAARVELSTFYLFRMGATVWKSAPTGNT
ncbi:MAG: methyltransferase domain-containing protein [Candidatus Koribacter versatilis]|uniref:Methyltransferase domain-containing protein n=1 Tax=Candidatus Korobacter versatilis TaxID=658062 RepID=A0A932A679_9BACT|nr:methyltransferase domain-containing protein [Candidatus Koribacter versatilis]